MFKASKPLDEASPKGAAQVLLDWYAQNQRDLPWRKTRDPFAIWVAEVMLQQTQVQTVIPYYERFLARFPSVEALASADLAEVLALWQGLGYYARARNLHQAAQIIASQYGGNLPRERDTLLALPGIGEYTADALLSIAFDQDLIAIDGNVKRVLARLLNYVERVDTIRGKRALRNYGQALLPPGQARLFNQALMDLGAMVCTPEAPLCAVCPLRAFCKAYAKGTVLQIPKRKARVPVPQVEMVAALICRGDRWLMVRRKPTGLLGGLWELPALQGESPEAVLEALQQALSLKVEIGRYLLRVIHPYSHFRLGMQVYACDAQGEPALPADSPWDAIAWVAGEDLERYGVTGVSVKALRGLGLLQGAPGDAGLGHGKGIEDFV